MSRSTEENLGRRRFLIHRDKAIEHALERIRRAPASEWEMLSSEERAGLRAALTEIWENVERERWQQYSFSIVTRSDILALIILGNTIKVRHCLNDETRAGIESILLSD